MDSCGSTSRTRNGGEYLGCMKPEHNQLLQSNSPPRSYLYTRLLEKMREKNLWTRSLYSVDSWTTATYQETSGRFRSQQYTFHFGKTKKVAIYRSLHTADMYLTRICTFISVMWSKNMVRRLVWIQISIKHFKLLHIRRWIRFKYIFMHFAKLLNSLC